MFRTAVALAVSIGVGWAAVACPVAVEGQPCAIDRDQDRVRLLAKLGRGPDMREVERDAMDQGREPAGWGFDDHREPQRSDALNGE